VDRQGDQKPQGQEPAGKESAEREPAEQELPPLLKQILAEYSATGLPPAYLPKNPPANPGEIS
jgi:hypothetical protein